MILTSQIRTHSSEFKANSQAQHQRVKQLRARLAQVAQGGSAAAVDMHRRRGKLLVRERVERLLDARSPFLEIGALAAWDQYDNQVPSAGLVAGVGRVSHRECMVIANDATVKGGTYFPETVKKHLRAQEIALENHLPCIYLVDSGGMFLPAQAQAFADKEHFGRIFYHQARLSALGIAQVAVVLGMCTAGGAYVPAMADENIMVQGTGTLYLAGPPLVEAATGERVTAEALGGARMHAQSSGVVDHLADDEPHALELCREVIHRLNTVKQITLDVAPVEEPLYPPEEIYGIVPVDPKHAHTYDVREILARLLDGSNFHEFKRTFGTTLVCGIGRWMGYPVGILANQGVLLSESAQKGTHFIQLCTKRRIPLVFLQNISGFMVGQRYEEGGIIKHGAQLVQAVATASVPCLTVITGASHGAGNYAMCGRAYQPRFLWTWPNARVSVMGAEQAAKVLVQIKANQNPTLSTEEKQAIMAPVLEQYAREADPYYGTSRLWDDGMIDPAQTRPIVGLALSACLNAPMGFPGGSSGSTNANPIFRM